MNYQSFGEVPVLDSWGSFLAAGLLTSDQLLCAETLILVLWQWGEAVKPNTLNHKPPT